MESKSIYSMLTLPEGQGENTPHRSRSQSPTARRVPNLAQRAIAFHKLPSAVPMVRMLGTGPSRCAKSGGFYLTKWILKHLDQTGRHHHIMIMTIINDRIILMILMINDDNNRD